MQRSSWWWWRGGVVASVTDFWHLSKYLVRARVMSLAWEVGHVCLVPLIQIGASETICQAHT